MCAEAVSEAEESDTIVYFYWWEDQSMKTLDTVFYPSFAHAIEMVE
jgi:hypothetical protein